MRVHAAVLGLVVSPALAATIPDFVPQGLSAHLQQRDSTTHIALRVHERTPREKCDALSSNVNAAVDISLLGGSISSPVATNATCSAPWMPDKANESAILDVTLSTDTDIIYPVSTFHLDISLLRGELPDEIECISADITPEFTPRVKMTLQLIPAITFLVVLFISCLRTLFDKPDITEEEDESSSQLSRQSVLPGVSDCLYHLQFVFLTGALSLRYPGFYQPVVSHLNWFSLLSNSNALTKGVTYRGVNDGIYEINGTYGGTHGLELMTQIVGAPMTMELWVNMVILITFIAIGLALLLEINVFLNRKREFQRRPEPEGQESLTGYRHMISQVLRLVLSYFLLPVITLSAYQIDHASTLPAYHTSLAVGLIVVIVLAFIWLLGQIPVQNLGVFISDHSKAYQPIPTNNRKDDNFVLSFFVLTFVRAIAIGGLQIASIAQIVVLIMSEIVCIACIISFNPNSIKSIGTVCAASRLVTLIFMTAFLPGVAGLSAKSIIGYILLFQQIIVLLFVILLPNAYRLLQLCLSSKRVENIPVYGVRQLRRRQTRNSINDEQSTESISLDNYIGSPAFTASMSSMSTPRSLGADRSSTSSRYYRPPRSSSRGTSSLRLGLPKAAGTRSSLASPSPDGNSEIDRECETPELDSTVRSSSPSSISPRPSDVTSAMETPLGPRWGDYSFREVDLAYGRPPQQKPDAVPAEEGLRAELQAKGV
ncbi:hypothetical protein NUW58_g797 [Xylaria curta]|uniref:Uncharacterized protein n=1 Tax=Xylaria curta TaxID=42375 RepID=A0ACC1PNE9_9PEZI|nr:hypothetical protein NUW58_g797 [Xylaria curta]